MRKKCPTVLCTFAVALRKESVDRNIPCGQLPTPEPPSLSARRAWIEIRACTTTITICTSLSARRAWIEIPAGCWRDARRASLSARRAWIEIVITAMTSQISVVALRKESVDRNQGVHYDNYNLHWSLSARRAWIEIRTRSQPSRLKAVALRKESVDRNFAWQCIREDVS